MEAGGLLAVGLLALAMLLTAVPTNAALGPADAAPAAPSALGPQVLLPDQGSEVPPASDPVAVRHPVKASVRTWGDVGVHHHDMEVPDVEFDRVFLTYTSWPNHPNGDPWDRTFSVGVNGTELVHGTTTRGNFSIVEDVTEYIDVFETGETVDVLTKLDTWEDRGIVEDVQFTFYDDPDHATQAGEQPFDEVVSPFYFRGLGGPGSTLLAEDVAFPADEPERVVLELFTSGHGGCGEFWYLLCPGLDDGPPRFRIYVDEIAVGVVHAPPYVYALLGFDCDPDGDPECEEQTATINQHTWWSAHKVTDRAGVHHGVGEIPSYRATMPADMNHLFTGEHDVKVVKETHAGYWPTSLNVLIDG